LNIDVSQKPGRRGLLAITVDEDDWGVVHTSIFGQKPSFPAVVGSLEEWEELFSALEYKQTKNYVLKRLAEKPFHTGELAKCLRERLVSQKAIARVTEECLQAGYLNDAEWVDAFIRGHLRRRHSMQTIARKLQAKGVPKDDIQEAIQQRKDPETEKESIRYLLTTRYRSRNLTDRRDKEKVIAALMRKGFSLQNILTEIKLLNSETKADWQD